LKLIRTMWGIFDAAHHVPYSWEPVFRKLKEEGYEGIEFCVGPFNPFAINRQLFAELLQKYNFEFIAQIQTCGYPLSSHQVADHIASFKSLAQEAKEWGASLINSHSGSDAWSHKESVEFFTAALQFEKTLGVLVVHETHRRRALYNPFTTRDLLKEEALAGLQLNLDVSHWVVVCERIFNETDEVHFWGAILALVADRVRLVHARVGYSDGPQVPDPSAPEYTHEVVEHFKWWHKVWTHMKLRNIEVAYVEPEHGPAPYLHHLPHTNVPVADLWAVNSWVGQKVKEQFQTFSPARVLKDA